MKIIPQDDLVVIIYAMIDPRTKREFYIGRTREIKSRLSHHISLAKQYIGQESGTWEWRDPTSAHVLDILNANLKPIMKVLERVTLKQQGAAEKQWIYQYVKMGYELTNRNKPFRPLNGFLP